MINNFPIYLQLEDVRSTTNPSVFASWPSEPRAQLPAVHWCQGEKSTGAHSVKSAISGTSPNGAPNGREPRSVSCLISSLGEAWGISLWEFNMVMNKIPLNGGFKWF